MRTLAKRFEVFGGGGRNQRGKISERKLVFRGSLARSGRAGGERFFNERGQRQGIKFSDKTHGNILAQYGAKSSCAFRGKGGARRVAVQRLVMSCSSSSRRRLMLFKIKPRPSEKNDSIIKAAARMALGTR